MRLKVGQGEIAIICHVHSVAITAEERHQSFGNAWLVVNHQNRHWGVQWITWGWSGRP